MTETEVRNLLDKLQSTITDTQRATVDSLSKITAYIIDQKIKISEMKNEIVNLKCEKNDWKQRANSAEERYETLVKTSEECLQKKVDKARKEVAKDILQDWFNDNQSMGVENLFVLDIAEKYGVEIEE